MPKRPPRVLHELAIPHDLPGVGPTRAYATAPAQPATQPAAPPPDTTTLARTKPVAAAQLALLPDAPAPASALPPARERLRRARNGTAAPRANGTAAPRANGAAAPRANGAAAPRANGTAAPRANGTAPARATSPGGRDDAPGANGELWHADVLELLGALADESVDLVVTDPPYAIAKADWDEFESLDAYVAWCDRWLAEVARVLAPHGSAYVCGFSEILADVKARSACRFASCRWLVWYYRNKANLGRDWGRSHESILHLRRDQFRLDVDAVRIPYNGHTTKYPERVQAVSSQYGRGMRRDRWEPNPLGAKPRDVIEIPVICNGMSEKTPHATQKPEALIERLILGASTAGQLVVDPFVGSGTTAVVAQRLGRRWIAGDADARYVGLARERLRR